MKPPSTDRKYPVRPEQFERRLAAVRRECKENSPMMRIPPVVMLQVRILSESYYGGRWHALWAMFKETLWFSYHDCLGSIRIWISDRMGWTKIYDLPETPEFRGYKMRHGRKCSGSLNCQNMNCIEESVPRWFKWLTRWED